MGGVEFLCDLVVDSVPCKSGDVVPVGKVPAGCLDSMLRMGQAKLVELSVPPPKPIQPPPMMAEKLSDDELEKATRPTTQQKKKM